MKPLRSSPALGAAVLALITLGSYLPALGCGYIWDDDFYVTANPTLTSLHGLQRIWLDPQALPQYYPLVHTTFWIERHLWGLAPFGYHLVNVLLHALNAILLWRLLDRLSVRAAWIAAAIFAVHPVHVESVAWITERKNVLSGFFYLAACLCLLRFYRIGAGAERRAEKAGPPWGWYFAGFALFVCALLAKTVTASLPLALLIVLWWKRDRLRWREVAPLLPMLAVGAIFGLVTVWLEKHHVGAAGEAWNLSLLGRCLIAGRALWFYACKLVWPQTLAFIYPRWSIDPSTWSQALFPLAAGAAVAALWMLRHRIGKGSLAAVGFFAVTLAPALGFFDVFPFRYSFVADHFQYLASIGLIALACGAAATWMSSLGPLGPRAGFGVAAVVVVVLGGLTWHQSHIYRDEETLWRDTIAKNPGGWMAYCNLGTLFYKRGEDARAEPYLREALRGAPRDANTHYSLARTLMNQGKLEEAASLVAEERSFWPAGERTLENLGFLALLRGDAKGAVNWFSETVRLYPDSATAHANLADLLKAEGRSAEAKAHLDAVVRIVGAEEAGKLNR